MWKNMVYCILWAALMLFLRFFHSYIPWWTFVFRFGFNTFGCFRCRCFMFTQYRYWSSSMHHCTKLLQLASRHSSVSKRSLLSCPRNAFCTLPSTYLVVVHYYISDREGDDDGTAPICNGLLYFLLRIFIISFICLSSFGVKVLPLIDLLRRIVLVVYLEGDRID